MPDPPAAGTETPDPSEDEIARFLRQRFRWRMTALVLLCVVLAVSGGLLVPALEQTKFRLARATERLVPRGPVESGGTASYTAQLAGPSDKVRIELGVRPAESPVTCEPRTVDLVVRGQGVDGGTWRGTYPGPAAGGFAAEVRVSERARTISWDITPLAGEQGDSCRYETAVFGVSSARDSDTGTILLAVGVLGVGVLVLAALVYRKRHLLRRPPWLAPLVEVQQARARERAAEQGIEDALRRGRGRPAEPWPPDLDDEEDTEPVSGAGGADRPARRRRRPAPAGEPDALVLADLWTVTHARLDKYHGIAQTQARHAFRNAQVAMGIGFGMLVGFTVLALIADNTATSIVAGVLGASSAALAGFIGRTFVRSQESTVETLRAYFTQPLEFSRYLAAERLVDGADLTREQRAEILGAIAQAIVAQPGAAPQDPQQQNPGNGR
ncbi:TRADD-N-associated membrane domain-containing protein [Streptomyces sp. 184]|uniref:TRADD-N-associated membrane domain-containing protein n=1 Tax=Streptomyces sp. 184 TaxID=1827526 RepID=UPI0038924EDB